MKVVLRVVDGKANVRELVLGPDTVLGRGTDCTIKIASSEVSRKHCRIRVRGDQVRVTDLGSSNGTTLAGEALAPNVEVVAEPGSVLGMGPLKFQLVFDAPVPVPTEGVEEGMGTWVDTPPNPGAPEAFGSSVTNIASAIVTASSFNLLAAEPAPVVRNVPSSGEEPSEGTMFDMNQKDLEAAGAEFSSGAGADDASSQDARVTQKRSWGWWGSRSPKPQEPNLPPASVEPPATISEPPQTISEASEAAENDSVLRSGSATVNDPELFQGFGDEGQPPAVAGEPSAQKGDVNPEFNDALNAFLKQL